MKEVKEIRLQDCEISDKGASDLFEYIKVNPMPNLEVIDMSVNHITDSILGQVKNLLTAN